MVVRTCRDLIRYIQNNRLEDFPVAVGCQGYTNLDDFELETMVDVTYDNVVMIHDECYYEELEE